MQIKFPWKVEIRIPSLSDAIKDINKPLPNDRRFRPPSIDTVYQKTIEFQEKLYMTFKFDYCDVCSKKVFFESDGKLLSLNNILVNKLLRTPETISLPALLCPCSMQWYHVHQFRISVDQFLPHIFICKSCHDSLAQEKLPKFSISNYFFVENLPTELQDLSVAETLLISKVYKRSVIWQVGKNQHSALNQHILGFENDVNNYTTILPRRTNELQALLKMVFLKDNEDIQMLPKVGIVRKERVLKALRWLQENNQHYHDIQIDESVLEIDIVELDPEYVESEDNLDHIIPSHVNFTQYQETIQVPISNGAFAERSYSAGLYQVPNNVEDRKSFTIKGAMNNWIKHASDGLLAQFHNTELMDIFGDLSWIPMSYPTLFPFGKTGPGAIRMAKVTFEEWINHLLQVKDGRFREHFDFPLFMFNIVQRRKVSMSTK